MRTICIHLIMRMRFAKFLLQFLVLTCYRRVRQCDMEKKKLLFFFLPVSALIFIVLYQLQTEANFYKRMKIGRLKWWASEVYGNSAMNVKASSKRGLILVYSTLFGSPEWYHLPAKDAANFSSRCEYKNCEVTYDNNRLGESDIVVFHARDMPSANFLQDYSRTTRPQNQRWVYMIWESPYHTPNRNPLDGLFNWTGTYKKQSDIWLPYKKYEALIENEANHPFRNYAEEKNGVANRKLALWINSNCGRFRDKYVLKLQELITLDVAGGCAKNFKNPFHNCNAGGKLACVENARKYKFYLAFENSFCDQYVTEKYWYNALEFDSVPVVMGGGPYNDPKVAIPGSFINVEDFPTVKALADYLNYLDKNDTAYNEYFKWKTKYKLSFDLGWPYPDIWVCEICKKFHTDNSIKVYDRLSDFWSLDSCGNDKETKLQQIIDRS